MILLTRPTQVEHFFCYLPKTIAGCSVLPPPSIQYGPTVHTPSRSTTPITVVQCPTAPGSLNATGTGLMAYCCPRAGFGPGLFGRDRNSDSTHDQTEGSIENPSRYGALHCSTLLLSKIPEPSRCFSNFRGTLQYGTNINPHCTSRPEAGTPAACPKRSPTPSIPVNPLCCGAARRLARGKPPSR